MTLEDDHLMTAHRETVRARETGGASTDHRYAFTRIGLTLEQLNVALDRRVSGVALQATNLNRLVFGGVANTGLFAQGLGWAHPGAHATHDVGFENGARGADYVAGANTVNEPGDVDTRWALLHTGCVVTKVAPVSRDPRLVSAQQRVAKMFQGEAIFSIV